MQQRDPAKEIAQFYNDYPFPNLDIKTKKDLKEKGTYKLLYPLTKDYLIKDKLLKILDAGCGTGELMLGIETGNMDIDGIDLSPQSIGIAEKMAKKFKSKVKFKVFDFVKNSLPKNHYDIVYSIGVLHHTKDPEYSFRRLTRTVKKRGYIAIGIYNPFGEFRFKVKRGIIHLLAGADIRKRVLLGQKLFFRRNYNLSTDDWTGIADAYANPYRRYYSFNQLLKWFERNNIKFINSSPPIGLSQNIFFAYEILKNMFTKGSPNFLNSLNKIYERNIKPKNWELKPIFTFLIQISWLFLGRGTIINMIGRKVK